MYVSSFVRLIKIVIVNYRRAHSLTSSSSKRKKEKNMVHINILYNLKKIVMKIRKEMEKERREKLK